ncbi:sensor histidine kinase [Qipengyuania nanhaisediminis]|uniref:Histidine kinase-, DNA gyrase B-, and HSP90-like ATPase n=1 Tax=Qipengyuania nanhaisediminis TaxID=604088 RepID=A0A1I5KSM9_9SPHN|nr:histidine kinase [Qipengyuania nanhaisediminis]SFO87646.1 Histidine kinase-, DNA gyrase B-, and HSP90-like ATPase [Qipengyuania nanhaisediminis]
MAVLPFSPTPFFANKNQAFWNLQLLGWGGATMLRVMSAVANDQPAERLVIILIATITGFSLSLILSVVYNYLIAQRPLVTWGSTAVVLMFATGIYAFIDSWVLEVAGTSSSGSFVSLFVGIYFFDLTLLGAWSALYYAINFFLQVEEQSDRLERLEAQATSAQLAMLRYQLNPHFLFNTLNSISTLVLLKQTEPANAMLTRLSSFLRHTLVTQPGGKVSVAQEAETLQLYLSIEKMRFEDRLRTNFRIEDRAAKAQVPSMLLQPLIENAIKYGVSPKEEGAEISLLAQIVGPRLRITVSDTGPGVDVGGVADDLPAVMATHKRRDSTGVGLANIRDRLAQAYGDDHRFEIRSPESGGFTVLIEIPHELADEEEPPAAAQGTLAEKQATALAVNPPSAPQKVSTKP